MKLRLFLQKQNIKSQFRELLTNCNVIFCIGRAWVKMNIFMKPEVESSNTYFPLSVSVLLLTFFILISLITQSQNMVFFMNFFLYLFFLYCWTYQKTDIKEQKILCKKLLLKTAIREVFIFFFKYFFFFSELLFLNWNIVVVPFKMFWNEINF